MADYDVGSTIKTKKTNIPSVNEYVRAQNRGISRISLITAVISALSIGSLALAWLCLTLPALANFLANKIVLLFLLVGVVGVFLALASLKVFRLASGVSSLSHDVAKSASQDPPTPIHVHPHPDLMLFVKNINALMDNLDNRHKSSLEVLASNRLLARDIEQLLRMIDSIWHGVVGIDLTGKILFANQAMDKFLNEPLERVRGNMLREYLIPHDVLKVVTIREGEGQAVGMRSVNLPPDSKAGYGDTVVTSSLTYDESGEVIGQVLLFEDVTQDVAMRKRHLDFVERMAIEVIQPVSKMESLVAKSQSDVDDKQNAHVVYNSLLRGLYGVSHRVEDLRDLSRLENGSMHLDLSPTPLNTMLQTCIDRAQSAADRKGLQLLAELPKRTSENLPELRIDNALMCRAIGAVLENAIVYTPTGGTVSLSTNSNERELIIMIHDTGVGIAKDEVPHVFERFYRASNGDSLEAADGLPGGGIGLTIAREILRLHGAEMRLASKLGTGTNVSVILPRSLICKD